ncbi:MAG: hypothetical protein V2I54_12980 [Bacteroidales bacterium]|nr:hypothetical protein [Bacteroidales bacterium]
MAQQLFTISVKRGTAMHQQQKTAHRITMSRFLLAPPNLPQGEEKEKASPDLSKGEEKEREEKKEKRK